MAAGEGRRLRPITERWPKPVLPIDGRPVIATLLHELAAAGCERAWVVTGYLAEQVEELVTGCEPGLEIQFVRQPEPLGSADAVSRALEAGAAPPCLVSAADTAYAPGDVARLAASAEAAIAWRRSSSGSRPGARGRTGPASAGCGRAFRRALVGTDARSRGASRWPAWPSVRARRRVSAGDRRGHDRAWSGDRADAGPDRAGRSRTAQLSLS